MTKQLTVSLFLIVLPGLLLGRVISNHNHGPFLFWAVASCFAASITQSVFAAFVRIYGFGKQYIWMSCRQTLFLFFWFGFIFMGGSTPKINPTLTVLLGAVGAALIFRLIEASAPNDLPKPQQPPAHNH